MNIPKKDQTVVKNKDAARVGVFEGLSRAVLTHNSNLMCVENYFEKHVAAPLHSHPNEQISYIVEGVFSFSYEGSDYILGKGDSIIFPANVEHSAVCLEKGIVLDVFTPPREDFLP